MDIKASTALTNASPAAADTNKSVIAQEDKAPQGEKFGEVWKNIQAQYSGKQEKPREIKKSLGKDDFLRLMVVQMKNQDPTKPFDAEQMASQMAQYASVEQLQNIDKGITNLQTSNNPMERLSMTQMIGKVVTIDRDRFPHTEGQISPVSYALPKDSTSTKLTIASAETGEPLFEKELGAMKAGANSFNWDGLKTNRQPVKSGNYIVKVEAKDSSGNAIPINTQTQGKVNGVSFEGAEPVFLVGDLKKPDKVTLRNIIKIDTAESASASASQPAKAASTSTEAPSQASQPVQKAPALFTFEKGKGSRNLEDHEAAEVAARLDSKDKGFPNGLSGGGQ